MRTLAVFVLALLGGAALGLCLPDTDFIFFFLRHRSVVTHSVLFGVLALYLVRDREQWFRLGAAGLALALAVHLSFDMFPVNWYGSALLYVPLFGAFPSTLSMLWLFGNIVACCYLALLLIEGDTQLHMTLVVTALAFLFASQKERTFWMPMLSLLLAGGLATLFPNPVIKGQKVIQHWMHLASEKV